MGFVLPIHKFFEKSLFPVSPFFYSYPIIIFNFICHLGTANIKIYKVTIKEKTLELINFLKKRLKSNLPGLDSQIKMAPFSNGAPIRGFKAPEEARPSAVLAPLFLDPVNDNLSLIFTLRSSSLNKHKGQISFPGGRAENNETSEQAALREAMEEIGLESDNVDIIGRLSDLYVPPSNAKITPVVGFIKQLQPYKINFAEVEEIFSVPVKDFLNGERFKLETWNFNGQDVEVPFWNIHNSTPLWGATAMILRELIDLIEEFYTNGNE